MKIFLPFFWRSLWRFFFWWIFLKNFFWSFWQFFYLLTISSFRTGLPSILLSPKIQQTKMFVRCQRFGDLFLFGWSGSTLLITKHIIKIGSKSYTDRKNETDFSYLVLHLARKVTCYFWWFSSVLVSVLRTSINVL